MPYKIAHLMRELASLNIDRVGNPLGKDKEPFTHFRPSNLKLLQTPATVKQNTNIAIFNLQSSLKPRWHPLPENILLALTAKCQFYSSHPPSYQPQQRTSRSYEPNKAIRKPEQASYTHDRRHYQLAPQLERETSETPSIESDGSAVSFVHQSPTPRANTTRFTCIRTGRVENLSTAPVSRIVSVCVGFAVERASVI
ncbi:hypothetical protein ACN38_g3102 [Penicillium nordicum]|uniref:Uncharacterized protein n=1 Tax=Penicillium nordicum TaxID=229535 RepID=A0A0M8P5Q9_9EURO|nr:hypothetical protein ACN38_g3102 [Penicillium nordicum]